MFRINIILSSAKYTMKGALKTWSAQPTKLTLKALDSIYILESGIQEAKAISIVFL